MMCAIGFGYYLALSAIAFLLMGYDKLAAQANRPRTAEQTLYLLSFAGGWPGTWLACSVFRHKTKKQSFQIRLALAMLTNIAMVVGSFALYLYLKESI